MQKENPEWLSIPDKSVITVEHPGIVKNISKGISSLGGDAKLQTFFESEEANKSLPLRLSNDVFRKPIPSGKVETSDIILRLTVPQRTGRKRKRGSDEPFVEDDEISLPTDATMTPEYLVQSMRDNPDRCFVEPVGYCNEVHRFRMLPDFQVSLMTSAVANQIRKNIVPLDYTKIKHFGLDEQEKGCHQDMDLIPPPIFAQQAIPYNYHYRQNPHVKLSTDPEGKSILKNTSENKIVKIQVVQMLSKTVPQGPLPTMRPESSLDAPLLKVIQEVKAVLADRPIATRRYILNRIGWQHASQLRRAIVYVAYSFRAGAFRDACVKFGVDPRQHCKYAALQPLVFQLVPRQRYPARPSDTHELGRNPASHIFDGKVVHDGSKLYQVCDITDPQLQRILSAPPRDVCDWRTDGWLQNGVCAKARVIMKDKIMAILAGRTISDADYANLESIPDWVDERNMHMARPGAEWSVREKELSQDVRAVIKQARDRRNHLDGKDGEDDDEGEGADDDAEDGQDHGQTRAENDDEGSGQDEDGEESQDENDTRMVNEDEQSDEGTV